MEDELRLIRGWVLVDGERPPGRPIRLRVTDTRAGNILIEAVSLPDGQFAVAVSDGTQDELVFLVEAVNSAGETLSQQEVRSDQPTILTLDRALPEEDAPLLTLLTGATTDIAGRIARLETSGHLPTGALSVLNAALGRFVWLDGLLDSAWRATLGDAVAAAVVREVLGAWAREIPCCAPPPSSPRVDDIRRDDDLLPRGILLSADAVGILASAVLTVGRTLDEQVELADGLSAILSVRPWLEVFARASSSGDVPVMRVMMGAPPPGNLGLPGGGGPGGGILGPTGGGFPVGPVDGFPGLPGGFPGGKSKRPGLVKVHPTVVDLVERFRSPAMRLPSDQERCLIGAMVEVARLQASVPAYRITGLIPADACPGTSLTITGQNFGTHGSVVFPGTAAPIPSTSALEWTDGRIRIVVPNGAGPGPITLSILEAMLVRCGRLFTIFRPGGSDLPFEGGTAAVTAFLLDSTADPVRVEPGELVLIFCDVTAHPLAKTHIWVTQGGATIADFGTLAGGGSREHDFTAPRPAGPVTCIVHLVVSGPCGQIKHQRTLTVAATPRLRIAYLEVTQGLQDTAHTVRLVDGRTTGVRAYLTSGLGGFSYTGTPGEVTNVTGTLHVERGGVIVASIPNAARPDGRPVTVGATFADVDRSDDAAHALVFVVPGSLMAGDVTMNVTARVAGLPGFGTEMPGTSGSRTVHAERGGTLTVVRLRMGLTNPAHPALPPSEEVWGATSVGTQDRYPLGDAGMLVRVPATGDVLSTNHFLGAERGWKDALADLDDYADRFDDYNSIFACIVPALPAPPALPGQVNGIAHDSFAGVFLHDRRCFISQAGLQATFAHEMAHTLSVHHAPCGNNLGEVDERLPAGTEPGVVGWRQSDGKLMAPLWPELMSYCTPPSNNPQDRWPSVALWNILLGQMNY